MNMSKTQHEQASTRLSVARVRRQRGGEKREAGVRADNHDRRARSELAGSPTWNQRRGCADLPSSKTLGDQRPRKRTHRPGNLAWRIHLPTIFTDFKRTKLSRETSETTFKMADNGNPRWR